MSKNNKYDVIVIGGGASGMMAAIAAAESGATVAILEKNKRLGEKLRITGGGRCNIWNEEHDTRLLLANYGESSKFLHSAFARFGLKDTIDFFHDLGLKTKVEAKNRAFPASENATDVVEVLIKELKKLKVTVVTQLTVTNIQKSDSKITSIVTSNGEYSATNYILATGGTSKPETGSTGDGFAWLQKLGHDISSPTPTITPLAVSEQWIKTLSGTTIKNTRITFFKNDKRMFRLDGDILCTHFGISGPLILNSAYRVSELLASGRVTGSIDLYPTVDARELDIFVLEKLKPHGAKQLKNTLRYITPEGLAAGFKTYLSSQLDLSMNTGELQKDERLLLVNALKSMPLTIEKLMGFEKAVVADGGISLLDIDTKTMLSSVVTNLYVVGDLLNIKRPTGGFSLQLCWTTGYLAGFHASNIEE